MGKASGRLRSMVLARCVVSCLAYMLAGAICCCASHPRRTGSIRDVAIVSQQAGEDYASDRDVETTTDVPVMLYAVVRAEANGMARYYSTAGSVVLDGKSIQTAPWPRDKGALQFEWFSLSPRLREYNNVDKDGLDKVEFDERPVRGGWSLAAPRRRGTYRFRVQASNGSGWVSTPGREAATREGSLPGVRRVSIRENRGGGDNVDFMTLFFKVAYVFGNTWSQANHFVGIDCQDLCIYGLNRTGWNISYDINLHDAYRSRVVFDGYYDALGRTYDLDSARVSVPVRRGDIIHFATMGHYGTVYADRSLLGRANGRLDAFDDIIQTMGLTYIGKLGWFGLGDLASLFRRPSRLRRPPMFRLRVLRFESRT